MLPKLPVPASRDFALFLESTTGQDFFSGNWPWFAAIVVMGVFNTVLGEELLFRGFLQGRLEALLGARRGAGFLAALLQALAFGLAHAYQGPTGILVTGCLGLLFGLLYLRTKSLWPLVVAHGLIDTVSLLALYAGALPA
jgi:membrane protease YdiL (CAAX protease family)